MLHHTNKSTFYFTALTILSFLLQKALTQRANMFGIAIRSFRHAAMSAALRYQHNATVTQPSHPFVGRCNEYQRESWGVYKQADRAMH